MDTVTPIKQGLLKKVKPKLKLKYFVLHKDGKDYARLEYYDSLKDWEKKKKPKRTICLRTCFSINAFSNSKVNHGLTLYTKDDSFQIAYETEDERDSWLVTMRALTSTHRDARPMFQHVWNVTIRERDLGKTYIGEYRLCLNDRTVIFVKKACVDPSLVFPLEVIRKCGHSDNFFKLEVGRQASTGPGEFWMEVDDGLIAANVHTAIISAVNKPKEEEDGDMRPKSDSKSSRDGRTFNSRAETSGRSARTKGGASSRRSNNSFSSTSNGNRSRSDSIDSRSTAVSSLATSDSASLSMSEMTDTTTLAGDGAISMGISTPTRSLTPDPRVAMMDPGSQSTSYVDMSPASRASPAPIAGLSSEMWMKSNRGDSQSSSSVNSWSSAKEVPADQSAYADMTHRGRPSSSCGVPRLNNHSPSLRRPHSQAATPVDDGSYAAMGPLNLQSSNAPPSLPYSHRKDNSISSEVGGESDSYLCMSPSSGITNSGFVRSGSTSSNQRPEKTQSFITTVQPPEPSPYLEMSPGAIANTNDTPYLDMKPTSLSISDSAYLDMAPIGSSKSDSGSIGRPASSAHPIPIAQASPYLDMAPQGSSLSSSPYMDMTPGRSIDNIMSSSFQGLSITGKPDGHQYVDMTGGGAHRTSAASIHGDERRIENVKSYVSTEDVGELPYARCNSVGSRPQALQPSPNNIIDQYVEMRRQDLNDKKSLSVPHLMPLSLASNPDLSHLQDEYPAGYPVKPELMMLNFDRPRTSSESFSQRPRGATWSQNTRPRAASHGQKQKPIKKISTKSSSSRESVRSTNSDYVDMQSGRRQDVSSSHTHGSTYKSGANRSKSMYNRKNSHPGAHSHGIPVPHVLNTTESTSRVKLSPPKTSGSARNSAKSNSFDGYLEMTGTSGGPLQQSSEQYVGFIPDEALRHPSMGMIGRRMSQPHQNVEPFPELSASSEEDVSMRSGAGSFSSTKSSSSSRSSLARGEDNPFRTSYNMYGGGLDPESYIECQQTPIRSGAHHSHNASKMPKPARVASFISEESSPTESGASISSVLTKADKNRRNKTRVDKKRGTPPPSAPGGDSYFDMTPTKKDSRRASPATRLPTPPQNYPTNNKSATGKHKTQPLTIKPPPISADPYMEMTPNTAAMSSAAAMTNTAAMSSAAAPLDDNYADMSPVNPVIIKPQLITPIRTTPPTMALSATATEDDPYLMMDTPVGDMSTTSSKLDTQSGKGLPAANTSDRKSLLSESDSRSGSSTVASTDTTQITVGTGSSDDSSHTLQLDETEMKPKPLNTLFSVNTDTKPEKMKPKSVPCYIRNNSRDVLYPNPNVGVACYIRLNSTQSQQDADEYPAGSPGFGNDDIIDMLAGAEDPDTNISDSYGFMSFPTEGISAKQVSDPISPILLPDDKKSSSAFSTVPYSYARSTSESSDIPSSAAELSLLMQQRSRLDQVKEEEPAASSNPSLKTPEVKSYIIDSSSEKPLATRQRSKPPQPPVPARSISVEGKASRSSSCAEPPTPTPENQPTTINYAVLTHDPNAPAQPEGLVVQPPPAASVDYTQINHQKTEELSKKPVNREH